MLGYNRLNDEILNEQLTMLYGDKEDFSVSKQTLAGESNLINFATKDSLTIVLTPVLVEHLTTAMQIITTNNTQQHLLLGLIVGAHIITVYIDLDKHQLHAFDSKISGLPWEIANKINKQIKQFNDQNKAPLKVQYNVLGTQSLFDDVSCGYRTLANIQICADLILGGTPVTRDNILNKTKNISKTLNGADIGIKAFIKKALRETILPFHEEWRFRHYALGLPTKTDSRMQKLFYFATLGFITTPILNLIRRPIELSFNLPSELANYAKNQLISWAPINAVTQTLRSTLLLSAIVLQGAFKAAYLATRTLCAPFDTLHHYFLKNNDATIARSSQTVNDEWEVVEEAPNQSHSTNSPTFCAPQSQPTSTVDTKKSFLTHPSNNANNETSPTTRARSRSTPAVDTKKSVLTHLSNNANNETSPTLFKITRARSQIFRDEDKPESYAGASRLE